MTTATPSGAPDATQPSPPAGEGARPPRRNRRAFVVLGIVIAAVLVAIGIYVLVTRGKESTDDAQVEADIVPLAPQVRGRVARVLAQENEAVKAGQVVLAIDDADYVARVEEARGELAQAQAQEQQAEAQEQIVVASAQGGLHSARAQFAGSSVAVKSADAQIAAARASMARAQAESRNADVELQRARRLREDNAISQQELDRAQVATDSARAALLQAKANVAGAEEAKRVAQSGVAEAQGKLTQSRPVGAQMASAHAQTELARGRVTASQAALDEALLALSYTKVTASADGHVSRLMAHEGQIVAADQPVVELVPDALYVVANFKETQIGDMHPGQRASVSVDAFGHGSFAAHVESLSFGTGARFSLLAPENATGNFVKVVQRVPVRIAFDRRPDVPLRAGLSANVTVYVR